MKGKDIAVLILLAALTVVLVVWVGIGFNLGSTNVPPLVNSMKLGLDIEGGIITTYEVVTDDEGDTLKLLMQQTRDVLRNRIDEMGLTEPNVYIQGDKRIVIELPGVENAEDAIAVIGSTAQLSFCEVVAGNVVSAGDKFDEAIMKTVITGSEVADAGVAKDSQSKDINKLNQYMVTLKFTGEGGKKFGEATQRIVARGGGQIAIVLDGNVISAPMVRDPILGGSGSITGNFTQESARNLALLIRGGALPAELKQLEYNAIGPTLGRDALNSSITAAMVGFILVVLFMIGFYRMPGFIASITLILYSAIILALMVALKATLTLPGIAGFVLSIGMAVDANVIIFERIKEELRENKMIAKALNHGFSKALKTILDANITTLIAAVVLFQFGSGPIRGFAITLMLGIVTSMFTAIVITRLILTTLGHSKALANKKLYGV